MTDRAFCFSLVLAELMVSAVVISPDDLEGVVLAKVMKSAKEIRPDDKKRGAAPAGGRAAAGLLSDAAGAGCLPAACLSGGRRCKEGGPAAGVMGCRGWPSVRRLLVVFRGWLCGGDPAAICGGNSVEFNQPLTTFLVVAMVWRLTVFVLCSYWQSRRLWRLFRSPWAWAVLGGLRGGFGGWLLPDQSREGVAEKWPVLPRIGGRVLPHILCSPPWTFGGGGKQAG